MVVSFLSPENDCKAIYMEQQLSMPWYAVTRTPPVILPPIILRLCDINHARVEFY